MESNSDVIYGPFISWGLANKKGYKRYYLGPCKKGHIGGRLVNGRKCLECANERQQKAPNRCFKDLWDLGTLSIERDSS